MTILLIAVFFWLAYLSSLPANSVYNEDEFILLGDYQLIVLGVLMVCAIFDVIYVVQGLLSRKNEPQG
jgi:hypothetical protein